MSAARLRILGAAALLLLAGAAGAQQAPAPADQPGHAAAQAAAPGGESVVAGLSQSRIAITANFTGSDVLVFGAVRREQAIPEGKLDVIITLEGPLQAITVRRKSRVAGIWVNTDSVDIDRAPSFYAVATTRPLDQVLSATEDLRHSISINRAIRSVGATVTDSPDFTQALIRIRERRGTYLIEDGAAEIAQDTLFRAQFELPANLVEGNYRTRIFLTRGGKVVDQLETVIDVRKVGLERWLYALSREEPWLYGLLSLFIAAFSGWAASTAFRYIRR